MEPPPNREGRSQQQPKPPTFILTSSSIPTFSLISSIKFRCHTLYNISNDINSQKYILLGIIFHSFNLHISDSEIESL